MNKYKSLLAGIALMGCLVACAPTKKAPPFQATVDAHLASITNRDLDAYLKTITTTEALPLIFPDGSFMATRTENEAMTKGWFADKDWRIAFEPVSQVVGSDLAVTLVKYSYRDTPDGDPRHAYLALTFQLQEGEWRLVLDQNTRIAAKTGE